MDGWGYEVGGSAVNASGLLRAFTGNPSTDLTDLGTLGVPNGKSEAAATNGLGAVVGYVETPGAAADSEQPGVLHASLVESRRDDGSRYLGWPK